MSPGSSKSSRRYLRPSSSLHHLQHFKGARNAAIGDHANFSSVRGDQKIYVNTEGKKRRLIVGTEEEEAEYAEFREIKRGDIIAFRTVCCSSIECYDEDQQEWVKGGGQTVVAGEVVVEGTASKCTVVSYSGEGAEEQWKRDFRLLGGVRRAENAQLIAINRSKLPMHVILGDLVPVAHLQDRAGPMGSRYLSALATQMGCWSDLWLDTSRGVFCRGPEGPIYWGLVWDMQRVKDLPLDAELLREDVVLRYLISRKLDYEALDALSGTRSCPLVSRVKVEVDRQTVISNRTSKTLAVGSGSGIWKTSDSWSCLGERVELPDGTTRFALRRNEYNHPGLCLDNDTWIAWVAQAPSVFHANGVSLEDNLCEYKLVIPSGLDGKLSHSKAKQRRRKQNPRIYFFIPLFSSAFWSFDPNGQIPISKNLCHYLGLPVRISLYSAQYSWKASTYQHLRDYQVARGFDPTTTDFARHLGQPIFDIVNQPLSSRFEELKSPETIETPPSLTHQHEARADSLPEPADFSLEILFGDTHPTGEPLLPDLSDISTTNNPMASAQMDIVKTEDGGDAKCSVTLSK